MWSKITDIWVVIHHIYLCGQTSHMFVWSNITAVCMVKHHSYLCAKHHKYLCGQTSQICVWSNITNICVVKHHKYMCGQTDVYRCWVFFITFVMEKKRMRSRQTMSHVRELGHMSSTCSHLKLKLFIYLDNTYHFFTQFIYLIVWYHNIINDDY